jgi:glycosyltransferase involved in cell wall biosynthesis
MKILILTQYFPPETGAPQNRLKALATWFHQQGHHVEVLTGMPNYPALKLFEGYQNIKQKKEMGYGYPLHRVKLFLGGKNFISRLRTYFSFCFNAWKYSSNTWRKGDFDWIFCESPPLFLGISAKLVANQTGARLWFNVSDLWPESVEKLGLVTNPILLAPFYTLERWLYKKSNFISGQTQGICKSIETRSTKKCHWYPNGISEEEINPASAEAIPNHISCLFTNKVILYSGNFGYAQGLEVILGAAENLKNRTDIVFLLIGDGPEKSKLEKIIHQKQLTKVYIYSSVSRSILFSIIKNSFASVVPLLDIELFHGAIPSKIFEPLALEVPVLLGVRGEAQEIFCNQAQAALFFEPENEVSLSEAIINLSNDMLLRDHLVKGGRSLIKFQFNRDLIHQKLFESLIKSNEVINK